MLLRCPECNLQVSDKAFSCPHCGFPLKNNYKPVYRKSTKKKRLPNGFGQITELHNQNLRKPFRVMVNAGFNEVGKPISKLLKPVAYFETYNEAYEALLMYNRNPHTEENKITLKEMFNKWFNANCKYDNKNVDTLKSLWKHLSPIENMYIDEIRAVDYKKLLETLNLSKSSLNKLRTTLNMIYDHAIECEYIDKNIPKMITTVHNEASKNKVINEHTDFTDDEMKILWENISDFTVKLVIVQCYMGWRPSELIQLKTSDVNIDEKYIVGGIKTAAGKNRIVPIHSKIYDIIKEFYAISVDNNCEYLFNIRYQHNNYKKITYARYRYNFKCILELLNINTKHSPHDCRVQFITMCKKYNVEEYAIKHIVGHTIEDLTEKTYTKRKIDYYLNEIEKIKA